jgi:ketol-acid reductoisomerase
MLMFAHGLRSGSTGSCRPRTSTSRWSRQAAGIASAVFTEGGGTPGLLAVHQDVTGKGRATACHARAIGCTRAGVIETTCRETRDGSVR